MPNPDTAVTQKDFQSLVKEIRKTNAKLDNMSSSSIVDKVVAPIKKQFGDIKDSIQRPFKSAEGLITKPFEVVSDTIESVGEAARKPFESFKNVSQGFKNLFKKDESQLQTELLEKILAAVKVDGEDEVLKNEDTSNLANALKEELNIIAEGNDNIVKAINESNNKLLKALVGNDLREAETEGERDKVFSKMLDTLENIDKDGIKSSDLKQIKSEAGDGDSDGVGALGKLGITSFLDDVLFKGKGKKFITGTGTKLKGLMRGLPALAAGRGKGLTSLFKRSGKSNIGKGVAAKGVATAATAAGAASALSNSGTDAPTSSKSGAQRNRRMPSSKPAVGGASALSNSGTDALTSSKSGAQRNRRMPSSKPAVGGGFLSGLNPMKRIKEAAQPIVKKIPQVLKRIPMVGSVVEGILLNSSIKSILDDPETPDAEKKKLVGTEFIKALSGPAGAAIAIGAVGAITGGAGFLASAVTGAGGYAVGRFIGGLLAKGLPAESIGGSIIDTFYKNEAAAGGMSTGPAVDIKTKGQEAAKGSTDSVVSMTAPSDKPPVSKETEEYYNALTKHDQTKADLEAFEGDSSKKYKMVWDEDFSQVKEYENPEDQKRYKELKRMSAGDHNDLYKKREAYLESSGAYRDRSGRLHGKTAAAHSILNKAGVVGDTHQYGINSASGLTVEQTLDKHIKDTFAETVESEPLPSTDIDKSAVDPQLKESKESLKAFEGDKTKGEYTFAKLDGIGYRRKYEDPKAQKEYEAILDDIDLYGNLDYDERKSESAEYYKQHYQQMIDSGVDSRSREVQDLKYRYLESMGYGDRVGRNLEKVKHESFYQNLFLRDKGMLPSEGSYTTGMAGEYNPNQMIHNLLMKKPASADEPIAAATNIKIKAQEAAKGSTDSVVSMPQAKNTSSTVSSEVEKYQQALIKNKEAETNLKSFESDSSREFKMVTKENDWSEWQEREYANPEDQKIYDSLKKKSFESESLVTKARDNYLEKQGVDTKDLGKDLWTIMHLQDKGVVGDNASFGINSPSGMTVNDTLDSYMLKTAPVIDKSQLTKNMNTAGVDMLNQTSQIANTKASLEAESKESGDVNTNVVDNSTGPSNTTVINEAPKHIDRTMQMFGAIPAY